MQPIAKKTWKQVNGVLLLNKPVGISSTTRCKRRARLFSAARGGHTGTLDPLASGLLPLCFGEATKFSADLLAADKTYEAELALGVTTDSGDAEGRVTATAAVAVAETISGCCRDSRRYPAGAADAFRPEAERPAALRTGPARHRGRKQETRWVALHAIELLGFSGARLALRVSCSKGTYIRTLAADIGAALGCGAHLAALRRTVVGSLGLADALTLADLEARDEAGRLACLLPVNHLLASLPAVTLADEAVQRFSHGNPVDLPGGPGGKLHVYAASGLSVSANPATTAASGQQPLVRLAG